MYYGFSYGTPCGVFAIVKDGPGVTHLYLASRTAAFPSAGKEHRCSAGRLWN